MDNIVGFRSKMKKNIIIEIIFVLKLLGKEKKSIELTIFSHLVERISF